MSSLPGRLVGYFCGLFTFLFVARVVLIGRCVIIGDGLVKGGDLVDRLFEVSKERKGNDDKEDF